MLALSYSHTGDGLQQPLLQPPTRCTVEAFAELCHCRGLWCSPDTHTSSEGQAPRKHPAYLHRKSLAIISCISSGKQRGRALSIQSPCLCLQGDWQDTATAHALLAELQGSLHNKGYQTAQTKGHQYSRRVHPPKQIPPCLTEMPSSRAAAQGYCRAAVVLTQRQEACSLSATP